MPGVTRRRSFVDRHVLHPHPPALSPHDPRIPLQLRENLSLYNRIQTLLDEAFPPANSPAPKHPPTLQSFQTAIRNFDSPLNDLVKPLDHPEPADTLHLHLLAEARIPQLLVSFLARLLHFHTLAKPLTSTTSTIPLYPAWRPYIPILRHPAVPLFLQYLLVNLLRAMNTLVASSDLLTARMAEDSRLLPLLFSTLRVPDAVELALALIEESLHAPPVRRRFDLSTVPELPSLISFLTPFQLGSFCRVLAPLVDEHDLPLCGGDHCTGACALPSHTPSPDWQQIEPTSNQLKSRRSYVADSDRALRDRNHAVLLAIPEVLPKLLKLIAVPPAPREELVLVDHAIRSGVFTLNFDFADIMPDATQVASPPHTTLAEPRAEVGIGVGDHGEADAGTGPGTQGNLVMQADVQLVIDMPDGAGEQGRPANEQMDESITLGMGGGVHVQLETDGEIDMGGQPVAQAHGVLSLHGHVQTEEGTQLPEGGGGQRERNDSLPTEERIRRRVLLMVFRRLTGMDSSDAESAGTQSWEVLNERIAKAEKDYSKRSWGGSLFKEKRRKASSGSFGVGIRIPPGETHGVVDFTAVPRPTTDTTDIHRVQLARQPSSESDEPSSPLNIDWTQAVAGGESNTTGGGERPDEGSHAYPELSINGLLMSSHQVEVLFVLYSLLTGRRKLDVQEQLIDLGIFPILNRFCDALDWAESEQETKTEESMKVHFIRLLHYMCDGLDADTLQGRTDLLFSEQERARLKMIETGLHPNEDSAPIQLMNSIPSTEPLPLGSRSQIPDSSSVADEAKCFTSKEGANSLQKIPFSLPPHSNSFNEEVSTKPHGGRGLRSWDEEESSEGVSRYIDLVESEFKKLKVDDVQNPGIICKVTKVLTRNLGRRDPECTRRYLLSGCIESYLRGASVSLKTLLAQHEGLLIHLLKELSGSSSSSMTSHVSQFRQTSFDLLGQLVKWNRTLFEQMNELFRRDPTLLPQLLKAVSDRLVDSNVFIRSIVISLERFRAEDFLAKSNSQTPTTHVPYDFANCLLWEFIETYRTRLLHDLISSVRVEDLNFENICCVNTTLILLVTSCDTEESLDNILAEVLNMVIASIQANEEQPQNLFALQLEDIFENFMRLVDFWSSYYHYQSLDVVSQELSSNIHFDRLVKMAAQLRDRLPRLSVLAKDAASSQLSEKPVMSKSTLV